MMRQRAQSDALVDEAQTLKTPNQWQQVTEAADIHWTVLMWWSARLRPEKPLDDAPDEPRLLGKVPFELHPSANERGCSYNHETRTDNRATRQRGRGAVLRPWPTSSRGAGWAGFLTTLLN